MSALKERRSSRGRRSIRTVRPDSSGERRRRPFRVREAVTDGDHVAVRELFGEYFRWLRDHREVTDFETSILEVGLDRFQREIEALPGEYAAPGGALFLARSDGRPVGCAALRRHAPDVAELKRLFVRPSARARGVGRRLTIAVLRKAHRLGYRAVVLDTLPRMTTAAALYRRIGFRPTQPYWSHPVPNALFFRIDLPGESRVSRGRGRPSLTAAGAQPRTAARGRSSPT